MNARTIGTIYAKELRDLLRDRRTLISAIVIPTFIMPVIIIGFGKVAATVISRARQEIPLVMVVGGADSPAVRAELEKSGRFRVETATPNWRSLISDKKVRAAAEIPPGFDGALKGGSAPAVTLYDYQGEIKSSIAVDQLDSFFTALRERTTARLLAERGLPASVARPFEVRRVNVAAPEKVGGNLFGGIVPYFIIFLCMSGAMYPAMDLTAGEKERGTMETLLCCPAARTDIVLGKFLMVLTCSLGAVGLSLFSMGATVAVAGAALGPGSAAPAGLAIAIDPMGILGVLAMVLPVAVLFSALLLTVSLFAKSFKEAQSYITPMMLVVILPAMGAMLPGVELSYRLAAVPILNVSLVSKEMLSGVWHWGLIAVIFGSTALYAAAALSAAVAMFKREGVIFRS